MIDADLSTYENKRVLLLQGPIGPFFRRLARDLKRAGAEVVKIDFNGGDWLFSPKGSIQFRGSLAEWPGFLDRVLTERKIDTVLLFGDCRPVHRVAHRVAHNRGLTIGVFEEGYIRPDYVTLELFGVNGHSTIPRNPDAFLNKPKLEVVESVSVGNSLWFAVMWSMMYYEASILLRPFYRHYTHHRPLDFSESWPWLRSVWRKQLYKFQEKGIQEELVEKLSGQYFLVPLQVHNDAQLLVHSNFASVQAFILEVVTSFAKHAPCDTHLVIKQHPLDRGYHNHSVFVAKLAAKHHLGNRVRYIHDQHLPTLLEHARGVVVVNSTVGLSALHHGTPTKVCGDAIYDMKGLTFQGRLHAFWKQAAELTVNAELYTRFRCYLIAHTQLNGNFYRRLDVANSEAGLVWPKVNAAVAAQVAAEASALLDAYLSTKPPAPSVQQLMAQLAEESLGQASVQMIPASTVVAGATAQSQSQLQPQSPLHDSFAEQPS